jgi:hypothetical protein
MMCPPCSQEDTEQEDTEMDVSAEDFAALFAAVSSWGRWGETDERGALHHLTPARVVAAAGLVRDGITVGMSSRWTRPLPPTTPGPPSIG